MNNMIDAIMYITKKKKKKKNNGLCNSEYANTIKGKCNIHRL